MLKFHLIKFLRKIGIYNYLKVLKDKYYENPIQKEHRERMIEFYSTFISARDLCFDIGANFGYRAEAFLAIGALVIAVEPQQECVKFMKLKFRGKLVVLNKAIGSEKSRKKFFISDAHALSSFSEDWIKKVSRSGRFGKIKWNSEIFVDMVTLDDLIAEYGKPRFIKIDVEGYELEVLKGLTQPVNYLSFEVTIPENTEVAERCLKHLMEIGNIECNFSSGESLTLYYNYWLKPEVMITELRTLPSKGIIDGDVYIRFLE